MDFLAHGSGPTIFLLLRFCAGRRIKGIRNELEVCEVELGQCAPMKCREALEKIGGKIELEGNEAKHVSVGATAAFRS